MIKIVPTTPEHLEKIELRAAFENERKPIDAPGAITLLKEGSPIAIFGGYVLAPGVYQVWGLVSDQVKECPMAFHRSVKLLLSYQIHNLKVRRTQMSVRCGFQAGWRWATALGFRPEGIMKQYGPDGSDYWLFGRVA